MKLRANKLASWVGMAILAAATPAVADAARAAALNDEGKALMREKRYADAAAKFQQAVSLSAEARFYFNLCAAMYQQGYYYEAKLACEAVATHGGDEAQRDKAQSLLQQVYAEAEKQQIDLNPPANPDGTNPDGTNPDGTNPDGTNPDGTNPDGTNPDGTNPDGTNPDGTPPPVKPPPGKPPEVSLFDQKKPDHMYTWALGGQLLAGGGKFGVPDAYDSAAAGVRLFGDYLLSKGQRLGTQVYLDALQIGEGDQGETLGVFDVGIAGYKDLCRGQFCLRPLLGVHVALFQPSHDAVGTSTLPGFGLRADLSAGYGFGKRYEHVIHGSVSLNAFTKPSSSDDLMPTDFGLAQGSRFAAVGLGYTYRFDTPFGSSSFVTLE